MTVGLMRHFSLLQDITFLQAYFPVGIDFLEGTGRMQGLF
jgi:hypothetical protein